MARSVKAVKLQPAPVYVSLSSIVAVLVVLRAHGTPFPIDEVALLQVSESMRRQVLAGLRFLRLIDARGRALPAFKSLIAAYETPAWPAALTRVLETAYEPLFRHALHAITPSVFQRVFRATYPSTDNVTRKAVTFFISAARSAEIPLNVELFEGRRMRRTGEKHLVLGHLERGGVEPKFEPHVGATDLGESKSAESPEKLIVREDGRAALAVLTDLLDEARMTDVEQAAVWTLVKYVRRCHDRPRQVA